MLFTGILNFLVDNPSQFGLKEVVAPTKPYIEAELDLLALWFTLVKVLYIQGCLHTVAELVNLLGER